MQIELPGALTIEAADQVRSALLAALEHGEDVLLQGGGVAEVDVAGLQLLCAAARAASARGRRIGFAARSDALVRAVADAGFGRRAEDRWLVEEADHA